MQEYAPDQGLIMARQTAMFVVGFGKDPDARSPRFFIGIDFGQASLNIVCHRCGILLPSASFSSNRMYPVHSKNADHNGMAAGDKRSWLDLKSLEWQPSYIHCSM